MVVSQGQEIRQVCVCVELGKVFVLSRTAQNVGFNPFLVTSQSCLSVHRCDSLVSVCSLACQTDKMYVHRDKLGADVALLVRLGSVQKARYEETMVNRSAMFRLEMVANVAYNANGAINDMGRNAHIITLAVSDGHIHVIDAKNYAVRYVRPGGSMNPANQPKSYVANERHPGFVFAWVDETKVVGVMGNLMRVFNYEVD